jgi:hypothetical protein
MPPVPRGMNLAGPSLFIDDAYCKWMQDVLVDRPGQTRMRGPLSNWYTDPGTTFTTGQQGLGAAETITPTGDWRGAVFTTGSSTTDGAYPSSNGVVKVFDANASLVGSVTLPFVLSTKWDSSTNHWSRNTIIDAKPALGGGVWIGITDEYGVLIRGVQALLFWRGAGKAERVETSRSYTPDVKTITLANGGLVEAGMFVFDTTADANGNGRYLGVISSVSGNTITLEKEPLVTTKSASAITGRTLTFTSFRGFVHQHGRGVATTDGGRFVTSGRLGSDAEGLFGAARATIGTNETNHRVFVHRYSDHQFIGKIKFEGTVSNTQVEMTTDSWTTAAADFLKDDNYFILRDDSDTHLSGVSYDTQKYSMLASHRRHDSRAALIGDAVYTPIPGIFNSTYANRQWFASVGNTAVSSDEFVNRVVFSGTDNPENINLSPDASDSIIIPGREAIRGIAGSVSGLLVFVESKTYIIRGTNRQNFALEELYPDGTLCTSSIVQVGGGVIWAGKSGVYYYDGVTVRNFTNEALGIFYTDGVHTFNAVTDRIYSFVYNNYLIINFSKWQQNYALSRWQATAQSGTGSEAIITLDNNQNYTRLIPTSITFNIFLPTGAIGTVSNMTPRGYMNTSSLANTKGIMVMNALDSIVEAKPTGNKANLLDLSTIFTEIIDTITLDSVKSNDTNRSSAGITKAGPDFYIETKQYNFGESTLRKWWRKILFNLSINNGFIMTEMVDINDNSLVDNVTGEDVVRSDDESGYFLIPSTTLTWGYYDDKAGFKWEDIEDSGESWGKYFGNQTIRYSKWIGIRQNSLGFKFYSLRGYIENGVETVPELVTINDWVFGLKPLRKGRN